MDVSVIYEFPASIWVTCTTLGRAYQTGFGPLRFDVVMPENDPPLGGPTAVVGIGEALALLGEQVVWAQEYGAFISESLRPATAIHRVAVTGVEGPSYVDRSWFTPDHQLAELIDKWFDVVRTGVEIFTGQDLDPRHRVCDAESVGAGLTFIEPPHQEALGLIITTPRVRPVRAEEWVVILNLAREGIEPPLEEILSHDARAAQRRNANRRAVIDAATALEIALGRHVRQLAADLPKGQQERINDRTALGDYISITEHSHLELAVPFDQLRQLKKLRNDAAHRGDAPNNREAGTEVQVLIDFLANDGRYRRTSVSEPDGRELVLSDPD